MSRNCLQTRRLLGWARLYIRLLNIWNFNLFSHWACCGKMCAHRIHNNVIFLLYIIMNMNINIGAWECLGGHCLYFSLTTPALDPYIFSSTSDRNSIFGFLNVVTLMLVSSIYFHIFIFWSRPISTAATTVDEHFKLNFLSLSMIWTNMSTLCARQC